MISRRCGLRDTLAGRDDPVIHKDITTEDVVQSKTHHPLRELGAKHRNLKYQVFAAPKVCEGVATRFPVIKLDVAEAVARVQPGENTINFFY